jgi:hypothetical protein
VVWNDLSRGYSSRRWRDPRNDSTLPQPGDTANKQHPNPDRNGSRVYTECSGIWNPIHSERGAALDAGLPGIIMHGTAIWALAGRELVRQYGGDPDRLVRLRARFRAPVIPGTSVTLRHGSDTSGHDVYFTMQLEEGRIAVSDSYVAFASSVSI